MFVLIGCGCDGRATRLMGAMRGMQIGCSCVCVFGWHLPLLLLSLTLVVAYDAVVLVVLSAQ
jgi:hypothetical protein